ncbi:MAG: hypothetical protein ACXVVK_22085 [Solirubrobacteraceae bacterium]
MNATGKQHAYVGQLRYGIREDWIDVSDGETLAEAASGAAEAYHRGTDATGRHPLAVRVIRADASRPS